MNKTIKFFLVVNDNGTVRANKNRPDLKSNEISIGLTLEVPVALFQRPQLRATLKVSEDAAQTPEITVEQMDGVKQAIEQGLGMGVTISIQNNEVAS